MTTKGLIILSSVKGQKILSAYMTHDKTANIKDLALLGQAKLESTLATAVTNLAFVVWGPEVKARSRSGNKWEVYCA